jgi:hypothetical protein
MQVHDLKNITNVEILHIFHCKRSVIDMKLNIRATLGA